MRGHVELETDSLASHRMRWVAPGLTLFFLLLVSAPAFARVLAVEIERRVAVLGGKSFGERGAYEWIEGRVRFGFDPSNPANARVTDIGAAPTAEDGLVHASADLLVLQPVDPAKRSGTALVDVANRGRPLVLGSANRVPLDFMRSATIDPERSQDFGDGFLMEQGLTVVFVGWQADAPSFPGSMRLRVPAALDDSGKPIRGLARSDWVVDEPTSTLALATRGHVPHRAADRSAPENVLTRRAAREGERIPVPRSAWHFDEPGGQIVAAAGFEPGNIYELVYVAEAPPLVGLGLAAFRDIAAYALHDSSSPFPVARAVATGSSQSGRFLRHFLHEGFNRDERGRPVYSGVIINIAGAGRGGFNHRFSHPGRVGNPFANFSYPGDDYPFASRAAPDLGGARKEGLFDEAVATGSLPKLFQINNGYEYWGRVASLIQMSPDGTRDLAPLPNERLYHLASAPHFPLSFPPRPESEIEPGVFRGSSVDTSSFQRALLLHMLRWVEADGVPPPSQVPRIGDETLVAPAAVHDPMPFLERPRSPHLAYQHDFGPNFEVGIVEHQPPLRGRPYAVRVPQVDALGNEASGIRALAVSVPIGTYLPWNLRTDAPFATNEMVGYFGTFVPFAASAEARRPNDERPGLAELYADGAAYRKRVDEELDALVAAGWVLPRDRAIERAAALERWEWARAR